MTHEIKQFIARCPECVSMLPSQAHEPILSAASTAEYPMQAVSTDLFDCLGKTYVIMVDRYSGFPFISRLSSTTTEAVWSKLMGWFQDFGIPGQIKSDGGPQYRQQFSTLCAENNIIHEQSAPYHPESNGLAEAAVKSVKALLRKLVEWTTPSSDRPSSSGGTLQEHPDSPLPLASLVAGSAHVSRQPNRCTLTRLCKLASSLLD
jgi:Integrase core domain.